jgi:hypothetical protein
MNERFKLEKSELMPNGWVCTDTVNMIVCRFEEHRFNETQKITLLNDCALSKEAAYALAKYLREMADWLAVNHAKTVLP